MATRLLTTSDSDQCVWRHKGNFRSLTTAYRGKTKLLSPDFVSLI